MMKKAFFVLLLFFMFVIKSVYADCSKPSPEAIPPFLGTSTTIPPNVLIVMDVSGSMSWAAYNSEYDSSQTYEGYFNPQKFYSYDSSGRYWYENNTGFYSGNYLNYLTMSRIDLVRWVLTGGRPQSCSSPSDQNCDPRLAAKVTAHGYTGVVLESYNSDRVLVPMDRINSAVLPSLAAYGSSKPRVGLEMFSNDVARNKVYIGDYNKNGSNDPNNPYTNTIRMINYTSPNGSTATGPAMKAALDYFAQRNVYIGADCNGQGYNYSNGFSFGIGTWKDPMYQPCKSDKTSSSDAFCSAECAKNFVILMSDGDWNKSGDPLKPAWYMHNEFNRTLNGGNFTINRVYSVGMFLGSGNGDCGFNALKNVSLYGSNNISSYPTDCSGCNQSCSNTDYGYYGAYGSYCYTPNPDPTTTSPKTAFSANNASELKDSLSAVFQDILKSVSAGSSAAVTSSSNTGSMVIQSVFWPEKTFDSGKVAWVGDIYGWWLYQVPGSQPQLKADDGNKQLNTTSPNINFTSSNDVIFNTYTPIFDAGLELLKINPNDRKIFTTTDGKNFTGFTEDNYSLLESYFGDLSATYLGTQGQSTDQRAKNLIDYIRGTDFTFARSRTVTQNGVNGVWKLGDIVYSSPALMQSVDYNDQSKTYQVLFVGANDGMLHAFLLGQPINTFKDSPIVKLCNDNEYTDNLGSVTCTDGNNKIGTELWAFIPKNSLPYLKYLADPNYNAGKHIYFNDLEPFVFRAYTSKGIKTILIGGMRLGGCTNLPTDCNKAGYSSYYAIDVTDPKSPSLLWEFSNPALGFSTSGPAIIKEYDGSQIKYFVTFLSGPTDYDGTSAQNLTAYILDLETGNIVRTFTQFGSQTYPNAFGGRLFSGGIIDSASGLTRAVPFGISYKDSSGNWHGKVFLLNTFESADPTRWHIVEIKLGDMDIGPVTAKVANSTCQSTQQYIYFGTGRYSKANDPVTSPNERIFGVDVTSCIDAETDCSVEISPAQQLNAAYVPGFSWYINLNSSLGERDISDPAPGVNSVTFTTALPIGGTNQSNSLCISGYGGQTNLYSLACATGAPNQSGEVYIISTSSGGVYSASAGKSNTTGLIGTFSGIPTPTGSKLINTSSQKGIIIQWLEK